MPDDAADRSVTAFRPCLVLPCYNGSETLEKVLQGLDGLHMRAFVVDDGSSKAERERMLACVKAHPWAEDVRLFRNSGKGAAILAGLLHAAESGFTHALVMDTDGRHDPAFAAELLDVARSQRRSLVAAVPVGARDESSGLRLGRAVVSLLCRAAARGCPVTDPLYGFRVYPIAPVLSLVHEKPLASHADFDAEILVRLWWRGVDAVPVPLVGQPPAPAHRGREFAVDAGQLAWQLLRLLFASLLHWGRNRPGDATREAWQHRSEFWGGLGLLALQSLHRRLPRSILSLAVGPMANLYSLCARNHRAVSADYLERVEECARARGRGNVPVADVREHLRTYVEAVYDKVMAVSGDDPRALPARWHEDCQDPFAPSADGRGKLVLYAHAGVPEALAALSLAEKGPRINVVIFGRHAPDIEQLMSRAGSLTRMRAMRFPVMNDEALALLRSCVDRGEWVAVAADRPVLPGRAGKLAGSTGAPFLGEAAIFPFAPYLLAEALSCPAELLFAPVLSDGTVEVSLEPFAQRIAPAAAIREQTLQGYVRRYAARLEQHVTDHPLSWFNFYDFWACASDPDASPSE